MPRGARSLHRRSPTTDKQHFECPRVGHYGIFNGSRFRREIAPRIAAFARRRDPRTKAGVAAPVHNRRGAIDSLDTQRREISSAAFTFSAAGRAPEQTTQPQSDARVTAAGARHTPLAAGAMYLPGLAHLTMWQLTGSLLLNGLRTWQPALAAGTPVLRQH